jgi:hypothetical protein
VPLALYLGFEIVFFIPETNPDGIFKVEDKNKSLVMHDIFEQKLITIKTPHFQSNLHKTQYSNKISPK